MADRKRLIDEKTRALDDKIRLATSIINSPAPTRPSAEPSFCPDDLEARNAATTSNSIINSIKDEDRLRVDGSNWSVWADNTKERMRLAVNNSDYLQTQLYDDYRKRVVRPILLASVSQPLKRMLQKCPTNRARFKTLQEHFHAGNRSSQMRLYRKLFHFNLDPSMATGDLHCIRDLVDEFEATGGKFTGDAIAGFFLQAAIDPSSDLYRNFENRIDHEIGRGSSASVPSFARLLELYEISKQHTSIPASSYPAPHHFSPNFPVAANQAAPSFQPPDTLTSPQNPNPSSYPSMDAYFSSLHPEDTNPNALAFGPPTCWNCGSLDHVKNRCPHPLVDRRRLPYCGPQPLPQRAYNQHPLPQQGL